MEFSLSVKDRVLNTVNLFYAVLECADNVTHATYGIIATGAAALTLGKYNQVNYHAKVYSEGIKLSLPNLYIKALWVLNPCSKAIVLLDDSLFYNKFAQNLLNHAREATFEETFTNKHIISRVYYTCFAVTSVITRTVDLALGILGIAASFATLGLSQKVNDFTLRQLQFFGCIPDLCMSIRNIVNPQSTAYIC